MKKKKKYLIDEEESKLLGSEEFKKGFAKYIEKVTWGKGFPKIYLNEKGEIVEHWKDGKIKIIRKSKI